MGAYALPVWREMAEVGQKQPVAKVSIRVGQAIMSFLAIMPNGLAAFPRLGEPLSDRLSGSRRWWRPSSWHSSPAESRH